MDASLVMTAARLVQCAPDDVLVARWQGNGFVVVWGIGWKWVFPRAEVDALLPEVPDPSYVGRAQMIIAPLEDDVDGLQVLFPDRLVKVLLRAGFSSPGAVQRATDEELRAVGGIGPRTLADIRELLPMSTK